MGFSFQGCGWTVSRLRSAFKWASSQGPGSGSLDDWPELTIGEVARSAGVATSSIRYYESIGLLQEPDRLHGQRRYRSDVLGKLAFVGVAQSAGFKLDEL